jgi:cation transport ATPase
MAIKKHISEIADSAYKSDLSFDVITFECAVPDKKNVTAFTAALQSHSTHPIASSVLKFLSPIILSDYKVEKFEEIPGHGIKGFVNGHEVIIGNIPG